MPTITSSTNPRLKELRRLCARRHAREACGRFVAEGEDLIAAAQRSGWPALELFSAEGSGLAGTLVAPEVLSRACGLGSGTRAAGVYHERWSRPVGPLCVWLHGVRDPGNVGTVLRAAEAFGANSVAFGPGCADPFAPKAVRASMGAIFAVPVARAQAADELPGQRVALAARRGQPLARIEGELTLVVGAEREGLPEDVLAGCDLIAHIPIASESLNAAMAATVALSLLSRIAP